MRDLKRLVAELSLEKQVLRDVGRRETSEPMSRRRCAVERARGKYGLSGNGAPAGMLGSMEGNAFDISRWIELPDEDESDTSGDGSGGAVRARYGYRRITALLQSSGWLGGEGSGAANLAARKV